MLAGGGALKAFCRRRARGRFWQACEHRGFGERKFGGGFAEEAARCGVDAIGLVAEINAVEIEFEISSRVSRRSRREASTISRSLQFTVWRGVRRDCAPAAVGVEPPAHVSPAQKVGSTARSTPMRSTPSCS